ncbi:MAG: ABC transporter substrate-binding protein [Rhodospirillales bacterium]|nr:ABC transporter substrate-binding protein [Rhodospirillales bacterium]
MALVDGKSTHYTSAVDRATGTPTVKHLWALRTYAAIANGVDGRRRGRGRSICALRTFCTGLFFVAALAFAQLSAAAGDANPAAAAFMQKLGNDAIEELFDSTISRSEREARFRRLLNDHFDMAAISKFVLGHHWRSANEAQRVEFQQLFVDFIVRSYWVSFSEELRGVAFTVTGSSTSSSGTALVHTRIDMPSSESIRVDWRLRAAEGSFPILDIIVEGVSMGVTHRSEFASVIQSHGGVDGLIEVLRAKNLQSASRSTKP